MSNQLLTELVTGGEEIHRVVVRITTSFWQSDRGLHKQRSLSFQKRKCRGHNFVAEDASCASPEDTIRSIVNLDESPDGWYEIVMTNISRDWESGEIDGYDFKLIPYIETP